MTHTHPPPVTLCRRSCLGCSWVASGAAGRGRAVFVHAVLCPFPAVILRLEGPRDPPGTVGAGRWCQVSFGSTLNIGTVGAERLSREPAVPETRCLWSVKKQTHLLNKSMHLVMRPKLEELQDTVK